MDYGKVDISNFNSSSRIQVATITCNDRYLLNGDSLRLCVKENGGWSGRDPICRELNSILCEGLLKPKKLSKEYEQTLITCA